MLCLILANNILKYMLLGISGTIKWDVQLRLYAGLYRPHEVLCINNSILIVPIIGNKFRLCIFEKTTFKKFICHI